MAWLVLAFQLLNRDARSHRLTCLAPFFLGTFDLMLRGRKTRAAYAASKCAIHYTRRTALLINLCNIVNKFARKKFLGNDEKQTWGSWMKSVNSTSVLLGTLFGLKMFSRQPIINPVSVKNVINELFRLNRDRSRRNNLYLPNPFDRLEHVLASSW